MTIIPALQHTKEIWRIHPTTGKLRPYGSSNCLDAFIDLGEDVTSNCLDAKGASMTNSREHTIITDIYFVDVHGGMEKPQLRGHSSYRPMLHHIQPRWGEIRGGEDSTGHEVLQRDN